MGGTWALCLRLVLSAWQTPEADGRRETFASACLMLTHYVRVDAFALQKEDVEGRLLLTTNITHELPESIIRAYNHRWAIEMGEREVNEFPTPLAVSGRVAAATQNQALAALR